MLLNIYTYIVDPGQHRFALHDPLIRGFFFFIKKKYEVPVTVDTV